MRNEDMDRMQGVRQDMDLHCVDGNGKTMRLATTFSYDPADPFAVALTFRTQWCEVIWTFARELLSQGMTEPAGDGDVHVWPCLDPQGRAIVVMEFSSPDGELLVQAHAGDISSFLSRSWESVAAGTESGHIDVDDLINQLLAA